MYGLRYRATEKPVLVFLETHPAAFTVWIGRQSSPLSMWLARSSFQIVFQKSTGKGEDRTELLNCAKRAVVGLSIYRRQLRQQSQHPPFGIHCLAFAR